MSTLCLYLLVVAAPLDVQTRTMARADGHDPLKLPFVVGAGAVAERINIVVYMTLLSTAPPAAQAPLTEVGDAKWYRSLGFTVVRNDDRLLELGFAGETCSGSTCDPHHSTLTFDARTGRSIDLVDIFEAPGLELIAKRMKAERMRRYREQVRRLAHVTNRYSELGNKLTFNEGCLRLETTYDTRVESLAATFAGKSVTVTAEPCSTHATRAYDDVGEVSITVAYGDREAPMTPYGKALLVGGGDAASPASLFGQALRGTIGANSATAVLERPKPDGSFNGHYFYDKRGVTIAVRGRRDPDGTLQILESASARFSLIPANATLTGKWFGEARTLDVQLSQ